MTIPLYQKKANATHFESMAKLTQMYIWSDKQLFYKIKDNKFVCDTQEKIDALSSITTKKWFKENSIK